MNIIKLGKKQGYRIELSERGYNFPKFFNVIKQKHLLILCDRNTVKYSQKFIERIKPFADYTIHCFSDFKLVLNERNCEVLINNYKKIDYVLAIGSGTLTELAKYVALNKDVECGVLITAPSTDKFLCKDANILIKNEIVSIPTKAVNDLLIDFEMLTTTPKVMLYGGFQIVLSKIIPLIHFQIGLIGKKNKTYKKIFKEFVKINERIKILSKTIKKLSLNDIKILTELLIDLSLINNQLNNGLNNSNVNHIANKIIDEVKPKIESYYCEVIGLGFLIELKIVEKLQQEIFDLIEKERVGLLNQAPPPPTSVPTETEDQEQVETNNKNLENKTIILEILKTAPNYLTIFNIYKELKVRKYLVEFGLNEEDLENIIGEDNIINIANKMDVISECKKEVIKNLLKEPDNKKKKNIKKKRK